MEVEIICRWHRPSAVATAKRISKILAVLLMYNELPVLQSDLHLSVSLGAECAILGANVH
jgi:hypothetical protein